MTRRSQQSAAGAEDAPKLAIAPEKVCWLIVKAREFDVKDVATESGGGSNASDDRMISVLEDRSDDPVEQELREFIGSLTEDEQIDLVALMWLGRDDNAAADWTAVRAEAARGHANHPRQTARYLLGEPLLSDYLDEALALLGMSCNYVEIERP